MVKAASVWSVFGVRWMMTSRELLLLPLPLQQFPALFSVLINY
jgi:hypothetical protein